MVSLELISSSAIHFCVGRCLTTSFSQFPTSENQSSSPPFPWRISVASLLRWILHKNKKNSFSRMHHIHKMGIKASKGIALRRSGMKTVRGIAHCWF